MECVIKKDFIRNCRVLYQEVALPGIHLWTRVRNIIGGPSGAGYI